MPLLAELDGLVIVLVRPRNPLNIGAVARAMSNFGAHHLRVVNPYAVAFRDARSAVGASIVLKNAEEFESVADAVADCSLVVGTTAVRNRNLQNPLLHLNQAGSEIRVRLKSGSVAVLFGSEKIGLTNDDFNYCQWLLTIPTQEQQISMNLGQAVAVCLYELARATPQEVPAEENEPASAGEVERITGLLFEALKLSWYVKPGTDDLFEKKVRRLMLHLNLQTTDAKVFLGMVRQIVWKLRQTGKN